MGEILNTSLYYVFCRESRQATINEVPNPYMLGDNSLSYKDYSGSRNNRFATPEQAAKNRITPPTRCLHFFNAPAGADEAEVEEVFDRFLQLVHIFLMLFLIFFPTF